MFYVYGQQYRVQIKDKIYDQDTIEVDFKIKYDNKSKTNSSKVTLWNLSPATINSIKTGDVVIIEAGWPGSSGVIFSGEVLRLSGDDVQGGDTPTTISLSQSRNLWFNSTIHKEWKGPVKTLDIVKDLIPASGLAEGFIEQNIEHKYRRNWSFNGRVKDALIELADDCGARCYCEAGKIYFITPGKSVIQTIDIPPEHILTSPKPTGTNSWKFETILRWEARPGTRINIHSKYLQGDFIAVRVEHIRSGENKFLTKWEVNKTGKPESKSKSKSKSKSDSDNTSR